MIQIPYYLRQRITHQIMNLAMILVLIITLFPIGWMIYSSCKENNDILVGKVSYSHAKNNCIAIEAQGPYLWVYTSDGGINKFSRLNYKLLDYNTVRCFSTNYAFEEEYIWVSSADKGLVRVSKSALTEMKIFKVPIKGLDDTKIAQTSMLIDGDIIWYGIQYKGLEVITKFNKKGLYFSRVISLKNDALSPLQVLSFAKTGESLWIGVDKGLIELDPESEKIKATYLLTSYLPSGVAKIIPHDGKLMVYGNTGAFDFDLKKGMIVKSYTGDVGLISSQIESVLISPPKIYFGTNSGLSIFDRSTGKVLNYDVLFNPITGEATVIKGSFTVSDVSAIAINSKNLYLGSSLGRVSLFDLLKKNVWETLSAKEGHLVISWRNYIDMWRNVDFGLYLRNSFFVCGMAMVFAMIFATLAAYSLSRFNFPGAGMFSIGILATQMIPGIMYLIPIYMMFVKFTEFTGIPLKGTYYGIIGVYSAFFIPFSIWILRGFFAAIPVELEEAARIDGCSPIQVFWHIVLPLAMPGIIATGVYIFLTAWDELMFAWVLTSADTMTIPVGIRLFVGNYQNRFDLIMSAATVSTIPVMILFFLLQRHIVRGLTAGAVKG